MIITQGKSKLYLKGVLIDDAGLNDDLSWMDYGFEYYDGRYYIVNYRLNEVYSNRIFEYGNQKTIVDAVQEGLTLEKVDYTTIEEVKKGLEK